MNHFSEMNVVAGQRGREIVGVDRHQVDPVPLQPLGLVHRRHDHLALVRVRVEAGVVVGEAEELALVAGDGRQLLDQLGQPPVGCSAAAWRSAPASLWVSASSPGLSNRSCPIVISSWSMGSVRRALPAAHDGAERRAAAPRRSGPRSGQLDPRSGPPTRAAATGSPRRCGSFSMLLLSRATRLAASGSSRSRRRQTW